MTTTATHATYCRICPAACGLQVEVTDGVVTRLLGDDQHPLTRGFTCTKGRHLADLHVSPERLRRSLRRATDGSFEEVAVESAIGEIGARLSDIVAAHGPDAVALYTGTQAAMASLTLPFTLAFWRTIGSAKKFSSMTVDQSAKWVAEERLGRWAAGGQRFADADVWMLVGTNPLISMQGGYFTGFPIHDGIRRLQDELRRGLRLVVVDPRRTELAARAEVHLQIVPGTDAVLFAGMLRHLLDEGLGDREFQSRWAVGVDALRAAVEPFTPRVTAARCGIDVDDLLHATRLFGEGRRGMATSGTGPDMGPHANLAEHLIQSLNVVCGRFPRPGDPLAGTAVLGSAKPLPAEVVAPTRSWERGRSPVTGFGPLQGELPAATIATEILHDGPGRVRALIVSGANPLGAVPDPDRMAAALSSLDLLVTVDPFMSDTARLADYVIAPLMHLERSDTTRAYESLMDRPFAQYTPAVLAPPPDTIDDWEFFLRLAWSMGASLRVAGREYAPGSAVPSTDALLESFSARGQVSLAEVARHPHGAVFDEVPPVRAAAANDGRGRFEVAPDDVVADLADLAASDDGAGDRDRGMLLVVRRAKEVINSTGTQIRSLVRDPANPCHVHPDDARRLGVAAGDEVTITSDHGEVRARIAVDATLRPGVASMTHGFGGPIGEGGASGVSVNRLLSAERDLQPISAMPRLTAVPIAIAPAPA